MPTNSPATSAPKRRAPSPKKAGSLSYPSPILGIPEKAGSYDIDRAAGSRQRQIEIAATAAVDKARREAAGKVGPHATMERDEIAAVKKSHRDDVDAANRAYDLAVREAQSIRDRALNDAVASRDACLTAAARRFSTAATEIERALKAEEFQIGETLKTDLEALAREAEAYKAPAIKAEAERREKLRAEREAADKAKVSIDDVVAAASAAVKTTPRAAGRSKALNAAVDAAKKAGKTVVVMKGDGSIEKA